MPSEQEGYCLHKNAGLSSGSGVVLAVLRCPIKGFSSKIPVEVRIHSTPQGKSLGMEVIPHDWNLADVALSHMDMSNPVLPL